MALYCAWERSIPYVPQAFFFYYSVVFLPFAVPAFVQTEDDIRVWAYTMGICMLVAGIAFLFFPSDTGYIQTSEESQSLLRRATLLIAGRHNLVPSLHVAFTFVVLSTIWGHQRKLGRTIFFAWGLLLTISTLLTHQHHIIDVLAGMILGFSSFRFSNLCFKSGKRKS